MKVWITRDPDGVTIWDSDNKPERDRWNVYQINGGGSRWIECDVDPKPFKRTYGFTPRKGSCKQYELTLTPVKE